MPPEADITPTGDPPSDPPAGGISSNVPPADPVGSETPKAFSDFIPSDFKEKAWAAEATDPVKFFKMFDDQKTALSRRMEGVPTADAPQADWDEFNRVRGVPDTPDAYEFKVEGKEFTDADKAFQDQLRPILKEAGITPQQLQVLAPGFEKIQDGLREASQQDATKSDEEFNKWADETFGDRRETVMDRTRGLLDKFLPEGLKGDLNALDSKSLVMMTALTDALIKEYVSEDDLPGSGEGGGGFGGMTDDQKREEARKLMASDAFSNSFHPDNESVKKKVDALYAGLKG